VGDVDIVILDEAVPQDRQVGRERQAHDQQGSQKAQAAGDLAQINSSFVHFSRTAIAPARK
jgi:hypothetical protein